MYRPIERIDELKNIFIKFRIVETALDALIIFITLFIVLLYTGINLIWALIAVPILFFIAALKYRADVNIIRLVEKHYPVFRERIGTLYDNRIEKNIVVADLAASVDSDLENVKYSSFMSTARLGIRIAVILILVTVILSSEIITFPENPSQPDNANPVTLPEIIAGGSVRDIFGEPSVVNIGNDSQEILIYRSQGSGPNVRGEGKEVSGYSTPFPVDASSSRNYQEDLSAEYQLVVKNYFTNLHDMD